MTDKQLFKELAEQNLELHRKFHTLLFASDERFAKLQKEVEYLKTRVKALNKQISSSAAHVGGIDGRTFTRK